MREGSYSPAIGTAAAQREGPAGRHKTAYVEGVSTRRVDDLIKPLRPSYSSRCQRICEQIDEVVLGPTGLVVPTPDV